MIINLDMPKKDIKYAPCSHCDGTGQMPHGNVGVWQKVEPHISRMAMISGIYEVLKNPADFGIQTASQFIPIIKLAFKRMESEVEYKNSELGIEYEHFLSWLANLLAKCTNHPEYEVRVS